MFLVILAVHTSVCYLIDRSRSENTSLASIEGLEIIRAHCAPPSPRMMSTKFVRLPPMTSKCRCQKVWLVHFLQMSSPNVLVACKHPYSVIRKNKLDRQHALVEYNKFLNDLVNTKAMCFNLNRGKHAHTRCCCLHYLRGGTDQERLAFAAEHMWHFHNLNVVNQHSSTCDAVGNTESVQFPHLLLWGIQPFQ